MNEEHLRAEFEAWALSKKCHPEFLAMGADYGGRGLLAGQWAAWQAASAIRTDEIERLRGTVEDLRDALRALGKWDLRGRSIAKAWDECGREGDFERLVEGRS